MQSRNALRLSVCRKTSIVDKNGVAGAQPPTGSRGGSPSNIAPSHGEGVWGFGKDAEIERPKALQDAKPTKRSYRDREFALSYKKQTFSTSRKVQSRNALCLLLFARRINHKSCCFALYSDKSNTDILP